MTFPRTVKSVSKVNPQGSFFSLSGATFLISTAHMLPYNQHSCWGHSEIKSLCRCRLFREPLIQCCFEVGPPSTTHRFSVRAGIKGGWSLTTLGTDICYYPTCSPHIRPHISLSSPLTMKGCICHLTKWQIHPFISKDIIIRETSLSPWYGKSIFDVRRYDWQCKSSSNV